MPTPYRVVPADGHIALVVASVFPLNFCKLTERGRLLNYFLSNLHGRGLKGETNVFLGFYNDVVRKIRLSRTS